MKKKLDFVIYEDSNERLLFRFYPRSSHVHGFRNTPPKEWNGVYKVYYSWAIIKQNKWTKDSNWESEKVFKLLVDECSEITNLDKYLEEIIFNKQKYSNFISMGQPSSEWEVYLQDDYIKICVWDTYLDKGFRFYIDIKYVEHFIEYIKRVNQYMLNHSESI